MAPWQYCFALSISNLWPPGNTALRCLFVIYGPPGNTVLSLFLAATNNDTSWHYIQLMRSINPPKFPGITCNIILQYGAGRFSNKMNFFFFKSWIFLRDSCNKKPQKLLFFIQFTYHVNCSLICTFYFLHI